MNETVACYKRQSLTAGWTRGELVVFLYDHAISAIDVCREAIERDDQQELSTGMLALQKSILALYTGLKTEESEIAFNINRLLHRVTTLAADYQFDSARTILCELRDSFDQILEDANRLEHAGEIPPVVASDSYQTMA